MEITKQNVPDDTNVLDVPPTLQLISIHWNSWDKVFTAKVNDGTTIEMTLEQLLQYRKEDD